MRKGRTRRGPDRVYAAAETAGRLLFRLLGLRIRVIGAENLPATGPVVLASNHVSFLDFTLLGLVGRRRGRRVRFLCRHDVWQRAPIGALMDAMRHVPVDRAAPAGAYLTARALLRRGEAVGVFPEAGVSTSYTVRALMPGAAALAAETGAPLVPVTIWGPQRVLTARRRPDLTRGRSVTIVVGAPERVPSRAGAAEATRALGARLQETLTATQQRPEHRPAPGEHAPWYPAHLGGAAPSVEEARAAEAVPRSAVPATWW